MKKGKILHINQAITEIKSKIINCMILSYWDTDHILLFSLDTLLTSSTIFIIPNLENYNRRYKTVFAMRLFRFLCSKFFKEVYVIDEKYSKQIVLNYDYIKISTGKFSSSSDGTNYCNTQMNNFELVIMLNHNNKRVLIPGDCDYKVMNKTFIHYDYDLLLVSHHGAKIGKPPKETQNESLAIICCSDKYDNPDNETIETLKELGYQQIIKFKNMSRSRYIYPF